MCTRGCPRYLVWVWGFARERAREKDIESDTFI